MVSPIALIAAPLGGAFLLGLVREDWRVVSYVLTLMICALVSVVAAEWVWAFATGAVTTVNITTAGTQPPFAVNLNLGFAEAALVLLINITGLLSVLYLKDTMLKQGRRAMAVMLIFTMALSGIVMTRDLFNLFVFFELMVISTGGLVLLSRDPRALGAGFKFLVASQVISILMLIGVIFAYHATGSLNLDNMAADLARRVAASDATVMIGGESGTGKEVLARFIHENSERADGAFVALNCAAIPDNMLEAVLFGYEKGAFTGAVKSSSGKFEQAQGGTLLLDEISEMSLPLQAKLLRVLQEREVERIGGRELIQLDVRVLATSNRRLREEVAAGRFREDLFYRLNVFPLTIPALRERPRDILPLAKFLMSRHLKANEAMPEFMPEAEAKLAAHSWPGNVRELDNLMQRALILCDGEKIQGQDVHFETLDQPMPIPQPAAVVHQAASDEAERGRLSDDLRSVEEQMILDALRNGKGSRKEAAEILGISPRTLRYKLQKLREAGVAIP